MFLQPTQHQFFHHPSSTFDYAFGFCRTSPLPCTLHSSPSPTGGVHLRLSSDKLLEADTSLFDQDSSRASAPLPLLIPKHTANVTLNPFETKNDLVAPLSQFISTHHASQDTLLTIRLRCCTLVHLLHLLIPKAPGPHPEGWSRLGRWEESARSTTYSGSLEPIESHPHSQLVLAPVLVISTPVMFDTASAWSFEHPQLQ
ncbi:hypothetical protein BDQ17DRAFT_1544487 [Cyathus striatus]|nr:hypothetical protein BDQ17DRAFT_1544487 [Cyathus striatus]